MVFQILLSTKRDAVPITRDFMIDVERAAWARADGRLNDADSIFHQPC
jgi:cyclopropane-fatty-acyl-phospholipid synthase